MTFDLAFKEGMVSREFQRCLLSHSGDGEGQDEAWPGEELNQHEDGSLQDSSSRGFQGSRGTEGLSFEASQMSKVSVVIYLLMRLSLTQNASFTSENLV